MEHIGWNIYGLSFLDSAGLVLRTFLGKNHINFEPHLTLAVSVYMKTLAIIEEDWCFTTDSVGHFQGRAVTGSELIKETWDMANL